MDTLEKKRVHVTCCTAGFYVNGSDDVTFKPTPGAGHKATYHRLVLFIIHLFFYSSVCHIQERFVLVVVTLIGCDGVRTVLLII